SMTQQLLQQRLASSLSVPNRNVPPVRAGSPPVNPPSPSPGTQQPRPPGTILQPINAGSPPVNPPSPSPGTQQPRPPGMNLQPVSSASQPKTGGVAVLEASEYVSAQCLVLDEFLTLAELNALRQYILEQEMRFEISEVVSPGVTG